MASTSRLAPRPPPRALAPLRALLAIFGLTMGCSDEIPEFPTATTESQVVVRFDRAEPLLAGVPWPNDAVTWSRIASPSHPNYPNVPTEGVDRRVSSWLEAVNETAGWSTTGTILIPFAPVGEPTVGPAIDLANLLVVQRDSDFANDAIYVVDLETGVPVSLDFDKHLTSIVLNREIALDPSDTKRHSTSLLVETEDERYDSVSFTFDPTRTDDGTIRGAPIYRPQWDRDSDGNLDVPLYEVGQPCSPGERKTATERAEHGACQADNLVPFYDVTSNRLRIRPRRPLREDTTYAVVVTHRLLDSADPRHPVGSPFPQPYPPAQEATALRLREILASSSLEPFYGSLRQAGLDGVGFLWSFTTASPVAELRSSARSVDRNATRLRFDGDFDLNLSCEGGGSRDGLVELVAQLHRFSPGERAALNDDLGAISRIYTGWFEHPATLRQRGTTLRLTREAQSTLERTPFFITVPAHLDDARRLPVAIASHDTNTNRLDALRWAGQLARFGIGVVSFDHWGSAASDIEHGKLERLQNMPCASGLVSALLSDRATATRTREPASSIDVVGTRDRWRASAIEHWLLTRALEEVKNAPSPTLEVSVLGYIGQGEGGAVVSMASTLPDAPRTLIIVDPMTSPARAWARGMTWQDPEIERLRLFGPRIAGVSPERRENLGLKSRCSAKEASIRMYSAQDAKMGEDAEGVEQGCLPLVQKNEPRFIDGATVIVTNLETLSRRCVAMTTQGDFSLAIPAVSSEPLELLVYPGTDGITHFGRNQDCDPVDPTRTSVFRLADDGETPKSNATFHASGSGLGFERQSEEFRLALDWANEAFGLADPLAFLSHHGQTSPGGNTTATLLLVTPGNPSVAPDEGVRAAVALGLVPHLPDDSLSLHPGVAADTTPTLLSASLRRPTAELALSVSHLSEGVPRLMRHDPDPLQCGVNRIDAAEDLLAVCEPSCGSDTDCPTDTACRDGSCKAPPPSAETCAMSLADSDALAGDLAGTRAELSLHPLRLVRYAGSATADNLANLWQPRTQMDDDTSLTPTHPDWPLSALAIPLTHPRGAHGIPNDDVCQRFRFGTYVPNLLADFLASGGTRYLPAWLPGAQTCLAQPNARWQCSFFDADQTQP